MKKEDLDSIFKRLHNDFDLEEPRAGHQERFLEKLNRSNAIAPPSRNRNWWKPLSIAASIMLVCALGFQWFKNQPTIKGQVVEIAPEVLNTEFYFAGLIEGQMQLLRQEKSPITAKLVDDTLAKLGELEIEYKKLEKELINGGNSKMILNAMIINFQIRIDLLEEVLANITTIKNLNPQDDANFTI